MDGPALEEKQVLASAAPAAGLPGPDAVGGGLCEEEEASTNPSQDKMMHTIHKIAEIENLIPTVGSMKVFFFFRKTLCDVTQGTRASPTLELRHPATCWLHPFLLKSPSPKQVVSARS